MKITVNGKAMEITCQRSIWDLTSTSFKNPQSVIVLYNDKICRIQEQKSTTIKDNDSIEFVQLIGGG